MNDVDLNAPDKSARRASLVERLVALGPLAEGISHELHNPLNGALLQLAVLQRRIEEPDCQPATLKPVAERVEQALRRLESLLSDLVSFAPSLVEQTPPEAGDRGPAVATLVRATTDATGLRVVLDLVLELPPAGGRLKLLLSNLWPGLLDATTVDGNLVLGAPQPELPP
jgi:signal transduction histidine kinase